MDRGKYSSYNSYTSYRSTPRSTAPPRRVPGRSKKLSFLYSDDKGMVESSVDDIADDKIASWFASNPFGNESQPGQASLKLVFKPHKRADTSPFHEDDLRDIDKALGIPKSHAYLAKHESGLCGRIMSESGQPVCIYHRSNNDSTISVVLKYDPDTNESVGYLLAGPDISVAMIQHAISSAFVEFSHPILVPVLMAEVTASDLMRKLLGVHDELTEVEKITGFGDWDQSPTGRHANKIQHHSLAQKLGALGNRLAFLEVAVQCTLEMNELTIRNMDPLNNCIPESRLQSLERSGEKLRERGQFLSNNLRHMQLFGGLRTRMQAQQNVLFNLIAQQDAAANLKLAQDSQQLGSASLEIARDSKMLAAAARRDSSAMKIIAILTTFFLPGTFISAFFAMPLFNWEASSMGHVMRSRFWIYWAITVPVTFLVIGVVSAFAVRENRMHKEDMKQVDIEMGKLVSKWKK